MRLETLAIDRNAFIRELSQAGVSCSVHWRPLHLHPYYEETFGWSPADLPVASAAWTRLVSLPLFSTMSRHEIDAVVDAGSGRVRPFVTADRYSITEKSINEPARGFLALRKRRDTGPQ